jgi:hypothetical protein
VIKEEGTGLLAVKEAWQRRGMDDGDVGHGLWDCGEEFGMGDGMIERLGLSW